MIWFWLACVTPDGEVTPRSVYNDGLALMAAESWTEAEEKFLDARNQARTDQALRANSAYNLGLTYAQEAQSLEESDPETAQGQYEQAISWFRDVIHLQGENAEDARHNLAVALKAQQGLADRLTQGENGFAQRLSRLMEDTQVIRQSIQELIWKMDLHGDRERPAGYEEGMIQLAVRVRELGADGLEIANLAGDTIAQLEQIPEDQRKPEEQNQLMMMKLFVPYMDLGREEIFNARRQLRRLKAPDSLHELDDAMQQFIRAQDQLLAPPERLKALVNAQTQVLQQVGMVAESEAGTFRIQGQQVPLPSWLTTEWLTSQEEGVLSRTQELGLYFQLWSQSLQTQPQHSTGEAVEGDPFLKDSIERASTATQESIRWMSKSNDDLALENLMGAQESQQKALRALMLAWENFSDVKTVVEWTHRDNQLMKGLLLGTEQIVELFPEEENREIEYQRLLEQNQVRLTRLETLLNQEKSTALQQAQQSETDTAQEGEVNPIEQIEQMYTMAQEQRQIALDALERVQADSTTLETALTELDVVNDAVRQLRMMFFTLIEHLQDAAQQQEELWQRTGTNVVKPYEEMLLDIPVLTMEQDMLKQRVGMISTELQNMADEMASQGKSQESESLGDAFVETGLATNFMQDVVDGFTEAISDPTTSYDVSEMVSDQQQALEALLRAIQALQPPQQGDQEDQQDQEEDQEGEQNQDQQQEQQAGDMSQREAQRKMQAAKEKEAKRDQEQEEQATVVGGFVEKDW